MLPVTMYKLTCFSIVLSVQIAGLAAEYLPDDFMMPGMTSHAVFILRLMAGIIGLWLWGLSLW